MEFSDKMIAVPSADAEAARLRAALSAQIDVVRALESSVGELSAAWDARKTAYEARIHQLEAELGEGWKKWRWR